MADMLVLETPQQMRRWAEIERAAGQRIGLVPTMGFLHAGHLSLVERAQQLTDRVVVSIFVNPTQFAPTEDLATYPRALQDDLDKLRALAVDAVFTPDVDAMYPPGFDTYVVPQRLAQGLCGASRPTHFRGVCTVVHLLLRMTLCHVAVFGEKDYQQLQIIRRMARDLWLDTEVVGAPIVREPDGLAMSSRNAYLSAEQRREALVLSQALGEAERMVDAGERSVAAIVARMHEVIGTAPSARIDYAEVVDAGSLEPIVDVARPALCALAVRVGATRLIDNRVVSPVR